MKLYADIQSLSQKIDRTIDRVEKRIKRIQKILNKGNDDKR